MDPYNVIFPGQFFYSLGKFFIHRNICSPIFRVKFAIAEKIMEKWPEGAIGKAPVVSFNLLLGQRETDELISLFRAKLIKQFLYWCLLVNSWPAYPETVVFL